MTFEDLPLSDEVLDAIDSMHFNECTPIQEKAIPVIQQGHDLIAVAQTGTGKTAAYLLPVIDEIAAGGYDPDHINCLVIAPTRELVQQIDTQAQGFGYFLNVSSLAIYGGTDGKVYEQQKQGLKLGADVVIVTPGRLLAHMQMGYVDLSHVAFLILDEADRMLDMGFYDDIMQIVNALPSNRQTLLFSATMPPKIKKLAQSILRDPVEVKIAVSRPADNIRQGCFHVDEPTKTPLLCHILRQRPDSSRIIVFASSKLKVKELSRSLRSMRLSVAEMHSDLSQDERDQVMIDFKAGRKSILIATDIVARGIDIDDIALVVNYDVPHDAEDYIHRIGRTARAGAEGTAITLVSPRDRRRFQEIERFLGKPIPKQPLPDKFASSQSKADAGQTPKRRNNFQKRHRGNRPAAPEPAAATGATDSTDSKPQQPTMPNAKPYRRFNRRKPKRKPADNPSQK